MKYCIESDIVLHGYTVENPTYNKFQFKRHKYDQK